MRADDIQKPIPQQPWIYIFKDRKKNILYIWKAKNLKNRIKQYFSPNSVWKQDMVNKAVKLDFFIVENETEALNLEENFLKEYKPPYNSLLKGNNRYVYIKFTNEKFPQIFIVKQRKNDGATYIWPKYHSKELRKFLQYLRQLFQYRWCRATQFKQKKLCWDYYFWLCKWRCTDKSPEEYKKILKKIKQFFEWNSKSIQEELKKQINNAAKDLNLERANNLKKIYLQIETLKEKQNTTLTPNINGYVFQLEEIWQRRVYVICKFFEGKLIDIISNKLNKEDINRESVLARLNTEFWATNIKLTKKVKQSIKPLLQNFLDSYIAKTSFEKENIINDILQNIQTRYKLKFFPYHIECLDISHLSWNRTSWWLSCFIWWVPDKKLYRRHKLENIKNWDDYLALKTILIRKFKSEQNQPNLLIIDWWKWQLNIIKELFQNERKNKKQITQKTEFISLWKGLARTRKWKQNENEKIYYFDKNFIIKNKEICYDQIDRILIQIRDEAHNFANNYRKKQMKII